MEYFSYFSFIIFLNVIFHFFGRSPKNCSIAPQKNILPDYGGGLQPQPPSSSAYVYAWMKMSFGVVGGSRVRRH